MFESSFMQKFALSSSTPSYKIIGPLLINKEATMNTIACDSCLGAHTITKL